MALKALMLRKKIDTKRKELEALSVKDAEFAKREADLESSIEEASTDEERAAVEEAVTAFEGEKEGHDSAKSTLEREIESLENELAETERDAEKPARVEDGGNPEERRAEAMSVTVNEARGTVRGCFATMPAQERDAFFDRDDVKGYLGEIRTAISEKRSLTNVGLTIPQVFLGVLKETIADYSKLYRYVNVRALGGEGRLVVMGSVPEGVWTDCCANLNELTLIFNDTEINCWKVGGFFAVCNAILEDSDLNLASELIAALGQSIGLALDKAILYGNGTRMPLGIMTRLVQTEKPSDYGSTERTWVDLHTSNIKSIATTVKGVELFQQFVINAGAAKHNYSARSKAWVMNEATRAQLIAQAMSINAAGGIVSGIGGTMPVLGGDIVELNFVPDNVIIGGYFDNYLLGERAGEKFASSEHYRFLADETVFKGTARYDGKPVIAEAFVAIGINGTTPNATMTFAADTANTGA